MIRNKNIMPESALKQRTLRIPFANTNNAYIMAALAGSAMTVGTALTLLETTCRYASSICFFQSAAAGVFQWRVVGENQFGEIVNELVGTNAASDNIHTLNCYRRIISITTTITPGTATTVSIGWGLTVTGNAVPRLPLPFKPTANASVKYLTVPTQLASAMPALAVQGTPYYCVTIATNPLVAAVIGELIVIIDDDEPNL